MSITNTTKPTTSYTNIARASISALWSTITTTWASETHTWEQLISIVTNTAKPTPLGSYTFDQIGTQTIESTGGAMSDSSFMINTAKPT